MSKVPKPLWVYIPLDANVILVLGYVLAAINKQKASPDGVSIVDGDSAPQVPPVSQMCNKWD